MALHYLLLDWLVHSNGYFGSIPSILVLNFSFGEIIHPVRIHPTFGKFGWVPSFAASAVLLFATESPLAQPRSVLLGHVIAAFIGVTFAVIMRGLHLEWLAGALAVSLSITAMQLTKSIHPPAGASALIAVVSQDEGIVDAGFWYIIIPILTGAVILILVTLLVMNLKFRYPKFWI